MACTVASSYMKPFAKLRDAAKGASGATLLRYVTDAKY